MLSSPAHQPFFCAFALRPKLPTANMNTVGAACYEMPGNVEAFYPRSFAASSTSPTIAVGDQSFLAATAELAPALPGASSGCLPPGRCSSASPTVTHCGPLWPTVAHCDPQPPQDVTRSPPSLSLSLGSTCPPSPPGQLPCPWPSAFVRAVIGLYGAAFMGNTTPCLPVAPHQGLPTQKLMLI